MIYNKENPLRCFFGFAGYDSQALAFEMLKEVYPDFDYKIVGWSEIDKYAIMAHNALFPDAAELNFGDISKIDWAKVPDFDFFTYSSPCFVAGTQVLTSDGYRSIELLHKGDLVHSIDGTLKPVIALGSDGKKPVVKVSAMGCLDITCTPNHPFYIRERKRVWNNEIRRWRYEFGEPYKKSAGNLKKGKDYIGVPIIPESRTSNLSDETLWLIGRFIADGHYDKDKGCIFSIGNSKIEPFQSLKTPCRIHKHSDSCYRVVFTRDTEINQVVRTGIFGCGAIEKVIPYEYLSLSATKLKILLDGYMSGDGCFIEKSQCHQATTISKKLASSLVLAVQKVYGVGCKIYFQRRPDKYIINGREVNQHDTYLVRWKLNSPKKSWVKDGDFIWYPIKSVEDLHRSEVIYNITVDDNHTYTANNAIVFNCQDFSNAGLQKGGEEGSGTRSSLLWEVRKAVIAKRPKYLMMENVKALVSAKFKPLFRKWEQELASYGYDNYCKVLNAKDYGIPQNRERIFCISILNDGQTFQFPEPFKLELRLKDMLEDKVDEKYYLSDEKVAAFVQHCDKKQAEGCGFKFEPSTPPPLNNSENDNKPCRNKRNG